MASKNDQVRVVTPKDHKPGPATPGMDRRQAFITDKLWAGVVRTDPGMASGWHHHGDYDTVVYILTGSLKMESGPNGADIVEAGPGDFVMVPKGVVHRESNPSAEHADIVVFRTGTGDSTFNVKGPV